MPHGQELKLHTLGPTGTNCEAAAYFYLRDRGLEGGVSLYDSLEDAVVGVMSSSGVNALLGCIVYPQLNEIVFQNLGSLSLTDCFVMPTHRMVLAAPDAGRITTVLSHPAPVDLIDGRNFDVTLVLSNSAAARDCAAGLADACITTSVAAEANDLRVVEDFGPVPMGFSIHMRVGRSDGN